MNVLPWLLCLAFVTCVSSGFCQEPEKRGWVLKLRSEFTFEALPILESPIIMPKVVVGEKDVDWNQVKLERKLENLFTKKSKDSLVTVSAEPDSLTFGQGNDRTDVPFFSSFIGSSQEFRRLRGDFDVKFGDTTGTFSFKKGLMMPVGGDRRKNIILRPSGKRTLSFRFEF